MANRQQGKSTRWRSFGVWAGVWLFSATAFGTGTGSLVLFGGGAYTEKAVDAFVQLAGAKQGMVVVVAWATEFPKEAFSNFVETVKASGARRDVPTMELAPNFDEIDLKKSDFETQLTRASALFFTGGNQARIMDVFGRYPDLLQKILDLNKVGLVVGGKSAGTAVVSKVMITGGDEYRQIAPAKVTVARGMGLLPSVLVDQHFLERRRDKRLKSAMIHSQIDLAFGVDEDSAVVVHGHSLLEPIGQSDLSVYHRLDKKLRFMEDVVVHGQFYDLNSRSVVRRLENGSLAKVEEVKSSEM